MHLVLLMAQKDSHRARVERYVQNRHVDGVILLSQHGNDQLPQTLSRNGMPVVMLGRPLGQADGITWLDADNTGGARLAVEHLLAAGRRTIATITGPLDMSAGRDRLAGYRSALEAYGVPYDEDLVVTGDFTETAGIARAEELLRRRPQLDGLFAASDLMATGALHALRGLGRRVPEDIAIVGFDDAPAASFTDPPLTTIRQPVEEMARLTTELLLAQISTGDGTPHNVVVGTELILRGSG